MRIETITLVGLHIVRAMNWRINLLASISLCSALALAYQNPSAADVRSTSVNTVVVEPKAKSPTEIAIPPIRSTTFGGPASTDDSQIDLDSWLAKVTELNGLEGQLQPWHLVLTYDEFDEDGDNVNSGVYDELWVSPKKYKRTYTSDHFNHTDYANDNGLFRVGDQRWPGMVEREVGASVVDPFSYARTLISMHGVATSRNFDGHLLDCVLLHGPKADDNPPQYCFDAGGSVLRYTHSWIWGQTTYNDLFDFQGRHVARSVTVTYAGRPYLNIRIDSLEVLTAVGDEQFVAPPDAVELTGKRVSGVEMHLTNTVTPKFPTSYKRRKFTVQLDIVVGKDGHVISAHATSGPDDAARICEDAVRQWVYLPYKVQGEPVEVETHTEIRYQ